MPYRSSRAKVLWLTCRAFVRLDVSLTYYEVLEMNKDQIKGKAKDIGGKIQEEFGEAVGSSEQQGKGLSKQVEGKVQEKYGDAKEEVVKDRGNR
jgi:uncharacterized protein YjbJ (UPF0337 family)